MRYHISHQTIYTYNQPVFLKPHVLRLRPRCDGWQKLLNFSLTVHPEPIGLSEFTDLDGNNLIQVWFDQPTEQLKLAVASEIETYQDNPFNYLLEPWALKIPIDYPSSLLAQLQPYLKTYSPTPAPAAVQLAQEIAHAVDGNPIAFLATLNQRLYETCQHLVRVEGEPWLPEITWRSQRGSCRDTAVLFMDVCRAVGLGARFVSGYQEGDLEQEERDLHAWVEIYLPGAGWRGFDPTHGLAVADRHLAIAASALPQYAAPVIGHITPVQPVVATGKPPDSQMAAHIAIQRENGS